ncbi:SCO family protein [Polluticaenibacter yanchengensis]|uniref:SCO family protein n=1 Tax=Polluticaenibacter yanchengensis TaxID=3014562 RepID=A0ABT4UH56_9BACT|nr:SCO family protein [Chitinophagaceae bacterium LY-5]
MISKKNVIIAASLFAVLLFGFWYFLFRGTENYKVKLPVLSSVKPFEATTQDGIAFNPEFIKDKIYIANFFFTTCPGICPIMNNNVKEVYETFKGNDSIKFLSFTCQPEVDSVPLLKHYADSMQANPTQWQFLTGNKVALYNLARVSYLIDDPKNNVGTIDDQFLHSQFLALVDRQGRVRGVYDGLKPSEMKDLKDDINILFKE